MQQVVGEAKAAFAVATQMAGEGGVVLVTGSLYLVGELRRDLV